MLMTLHLLAGLLYALALLGLLVYGLNAYVMIALHWWTRRSARAAPPPPDPPVWPLVTVQLPLYNERYVAGRLLEAAGTLDYPADRLEIQVLDDSTDDTAAIVAETAQRLRARGVNVVHVRRTDRTGFKAGALASGPRLPHWRILYLPEVVCPAELPVVISGFKSQQRRWAKGSIQTALKLLPQVLSSPLSLWTKYQAFVHLTYYMIHPLMLVVVLLSVPALALGAPAQSATVLVFTSVVFALASIGPACMLIYAQKVLPESGWRQALRLPTIMGIGVGLAWSTSLAVLS